MISARRVPGVKNREGRCMECVGEKGLSFPGH